MPQLKTDNKLDIKYTLLNKLNFTFNLYIPRNYVL